MTAPRRRRGTRAAVVVFAVGVVAASYLWIGRLYAVSSVSMEPTLRPGERLAVSLLGRDTVSRGDLVVVDVRDTWASAAGWRGSPTVVKRVIGLPGERVSCCDAGGRLIVDGTVLDEAYLAEADEQRPFEAVVPPGRLWLMGDNRAESSDSRHHLGSPGGGSVDVDSVIGTVVAVMWPPSSMRIPAAPR